MSIGARKFTGTIVMLICLPIYVLLVTVVGGGLIDDAGNAARFGYFLIVGLIWVLPAGLLIRWMQRPDEFSPEIRRR